MLVLILIGVAAFGVFVGHVCGFGLRTRHTQLHAEPQTSRDLRDRQSVGFWETHSQDR
ncbi:hypothetical protein ACRYCC_39515 [Actinomadura scrupuli]|uniref:hypothetical protein n=1 Tax=Actinomadura scrupuli TaxID=559629 RepID=UPI003D980214